MQLGKSDTSGAHFYAPQPAANPTDDKLFIRAKIAELLERFSVSYVREGNRVEYFITGGESKEEVSFELVFCYNLFARQLHVSKFHPGLCRQPDSRYLSAACFFLLIHHCMNLFQLGTDQSIFLQCRQLIYQEFYSRLKDFSFTVTRSGQGENVDLKCPCPAMTYFDTSMISTRETSQV